jgi:hypothetical protein
MGVPSRRAISIKRPTASVRQMEWPASTIIHPRATANTMASVVGPSNSSSMRHCCGRPSVASYNARVQGWEFGLARHWSRLAQTAINSGPTTSQCDVSFPTRQPGESVSPLNRWARLGGSARGDFTRVVALLEVPTWKYISPSPAVGANPFCPLASRSRSVARLRQNESAIVVRRATLPR